MRNRHGVHTLPDAGTTLVEVLVAMGIASTALTAVMGLLLTSASAVADSALETSAIWVASRSIEVLRGDPTAPLEGHAELDREGRPVVGATGLLGVTWTARQNEEHPLLWEVTVTVSSPRLRQALRTDALVRRETLVRAAIPVPEAIP